MKSKITIFLKLAIITSSSHNANARHLESDNKPNILFILSDDHTSQAWGVYGGVLSPYVKADNIRQLASEGCVLENLFCTNSISVPSRASIMTGAYSHINHVYSLDDALPSDADNIAKKLQKGGYQTALIGKWHLKQKPTGFDFFSVFHEQGEYNNPIFKNIDNWVEKKNVGEEIKGFSTDIVTEKSIQWIKNRDRNRPFTLFCHFKATHAPWFYPERMEHLFNNIEFPEPDNLMEFDTETSGRTFCGQSIDSLSARWLRASENTNKGIDQYPGLPFAVDGLDKKEIRKRTYQKFIKDYLRCAAAIDDNIGKLRKALKEEGLSDNTIIVYVSDQGYFLGEHGFMDKRIMYEESMRMPCIIYHPKEIKPGSRNKDLLLNIDIAALLADYGNVIVPEKSQGRSFRSNLAGKRIKDWRKSIYYRYWTHHHIRPAHLGIRTNRYKLILFYGENLQTTGSEKTKTTPAWEFYDLENDPMENKNIYENPNYSNIISILKKELILQKEYFGDTDIDNPHITEQIKK